MSKKTKPDFEVYNHKKIARLLTKKIKREERRRCLKAVKDEPKDFGGMPPGYEHLKPWVLSITEGTKRNIIRRIKNEQKD